MKLLFLGLFALATIASQASAATTQKNKITYDSWENQEFGKVYLLTLEGDVATELFNNLKKCRVKECDYKEAKGISCQTLSSGAHLCTIPVGHKGVL